ncbi:hypothetical protein LN246_04860 [Sulfurovum mangrovi]|nr:hypothetical protein LN246_04860 [Sulfurovum mangrovi]
MWQSPDPILGEYISGKTNKGVFNSNNLKLYSYTYNNPINAIDPDGALTIFVHGTFSSPKDADPDFIKAVGKTFNEKVYQFNWGGDNGMAGSKGAENNSNARTNAAFRLAKFVENYDFKDGEKLNIVMHSHGGNVGKDFTQFYEGKKKIDNFIMMGTPQRDDYFLDKDQFEDGANILNVYDSSDMVQLGGGIHGLKSFLQSRYTFGYSTRLQEGGKNMQVEVPNKNWYDGAFGDHVNMDSSSVWKEITNEIK